MINKDYKHSEITDKIIGAFFKVYNTLGWGFLEKVYENAMVLELNKNGMHIVSQKPIKVYYEGEQVGFYAADLLVNNAVIVELKAAETLCEEHEAQLLNYLRATEIEAGLLLNFGKKPQFKKKVFSQEFKSIGIRTIALSDHSQS